MEPGTPKFRVMKNGYDRFAVDDAVDRMEWVCLNWNAPSIAFYQSLGAEGLTEWTTWRLSEDKIRQLAGL